MLLGDTISLRACCPFFAVGRISTRKQSPIESIKMGSMAAVTPESLLEVDLIRKSWSPLKDGILTTASFTMDFHRPSASMGCVSSAVQDPLRIAWTVAADGKRV